MAPIPWVGGWYKGLSTDTKPDHAGLSGWNFLETDTGDIYTHNGSGWVLTSAGHMKVMPYSFIIYIDGSSAKALDTTTDVIDYSSTDHFSVFNSVITDMNSAGGGMALVKNGTYTNNSTVKNILTKDNTGLTGESREGVVLKNTLNTSDSTVFRYWAGASSAPLSRFTLRDLTVTCNDGAQTETCWISSGTEYLTVQGCRFKSFQDPSSAKILFFIDTAGNTNPNNYALIQGNIFEGGTATQDMLGCGNLNYSDVNHNLFLNGNGQGIGAANIEYSTFNNNRFVHVNNNAFGFESITQYVDVNDNISIDSGEFKLSESGNQTANQFLHGSCCNNKIFYGNGGITAGYCVASKIDDNYIFRTSRTGIRGAYDRSSISNNKFVETNYTWSNIWSDTGRPGGVELFDNTSWTGQAKNSVEHNMVRRTAVNFDVPTGFIINGGETESGLPGGVMIDSNFSTTYVYDNTFDNLESGRRIVLNGSPTGTVIKRNNGYVTENEGATASVADGGTISHGLVTTPTLVTVTPSISGEFASVTALGATTFTVALKTHTGAAGTTQTVYWRAIIL